MSDVYLGEKTRTDTNKIECPASVAPPHTHTPKTTLVCGSKRQIQTFLGIMGMFPLKIVNKIVKLRGNEGKIPKPFVSLKFTKGLHNTTTSSLS